MHLSDLRTLALPGLVGLTLGASSVAGGPLNRRHVPAECTMLVHVDVEGLADSRFGQLIDEHKHELGGDFEEFREQTGLDPFEDVLDITMYVLAGGSLDGGGDGVVVLATLADDLDQLIEALEEHADEADYRVRERNGRTIHSFEADGNRVYGMIEEARGGRHQLLLSPDSDALRLAFDVIDGEAESLRESDSVLSGFRPRRSAVVHAAIADLDALPIDDDEIRSRFLSMAEGAFVQFGEDDDEVFADVQISTRKEEDAMLLAQIGQGAVAAGAIMNSADNVGDDVRRARAKFLNGIRFEAEDNRIRLGVRFDAEDLFDMIETLEDY